MYGYTLYWALKGLKEDCDREAAGLIPGLAGINLSGETLASPSLPSLRCP